MITATRMIALSIVCFVLVLSSEARAQDEKYFGMGIIIGEPTGLDAKFMLSRENALEFAAAWSLSDNNEFNLHVDYLFHKYDLFDVRTDELPLFFGVGGRLLFLEKSEDDVRFGVRMPVGLTYIFTNHPFDIFFEIVPILDLVPDTDFDLEGAIGARFWF